ncbi:MAG: hypothetical protein LKI93_04390 [Bifidobacteriaceae bacterium]|jgi:hypothetical protein|nr:hypothetical protein [Bifidobacteriaceae bacterium]MCI1914470.1 hypothetical protein [Bifidobacteriaceae bacterium]
MVTTRLPSRKDVETPTPNSAEPDFVMGINVKSPHLIVPLRELLDEEDATSGVNGRHRLVHPSLLLVDRRKRFIGLTVTAVIVASFLWLLFLGHSQASALSSQPLTATSSSESTAETFRSRTEPATASLGKGKWKVGSDLPPGRYTISVAHGTGNISSVKENGARGINEILSAHPSTGMRVKTVTTDLEEGEIVSIGHLDQVLFSPAPEVQTTTLTAGTWVVGFDVAAGQYRAFAKSRGQGTLSILVGGVAIKNEILGAVGGTGRNSLPLTLVEGQTVSIHGLNTVVLEKRK